MIGSAYLYWFDAAQSAHGAQQRGEFSDAEIAARQVVTPRSGLRRLAAALAERIQKADFPMAPAPV
jgi:hypothetical protein